MKRLISAGFWTALATEKRMKRFDLGRTVATPGAIDKASHRFLECLARHATGDWGDLDDYDRRANERALEDGARLLSCYPIDPAKPSTGENRIWIITEADRSATTILLPSEY